MSPPNNPEAFAASAPPFQESLGRTPRREDNCGERSRASDDCERRPRRRRDPLQGLGEDQNPTAPPVKRDVGEN